MNKIKGVWPYRRVPSDWGYQSTKYGQVVSSIATRVIFDNDWNGKAIWNKFYRNVDDDHFMKHIVNRDFTLLIIHLRAFVRAYLDGSVYYNMISDIRLTTNRWTGGKVCCGPYQQQNHIYMYIYTYIYIYIYETHKHAQGHTNQYVCICFIYKPIEFTAIIWCMYIFIYKRKQPTTKRRLVWILSFASEAKCHPYFTFGQTKMFRLTAKARCVRLIYADVRDKARVPYMACLSTDNLIWLRYGPL